MITESGVRIPQEGTARFKVFTVITEGKAPISDVRAIAREAELTTRQVTIARANLRNDGYLPKPTPELTRLTQHTHAATVFPLVQEYREMGLSPREIQLAVKIEKGIDLSDNSVHSAVVYGTKKGNLRRLSKEEHYDISRDANVNTLTPEQILENVTAILELRKRLLENNLDLPTNRLEWKIAVKEVRAPITPKEIVNLKTTRDMVTKTAARKPEEINRNIRINLGRALPPRTTIPDIFGDITDDVLKAQFLDTFANLLQNLWDKDPKTIKNILPEENQIIEGCQSLKRQNYSISKLVIEVSKVLGAIPPAKYRAIS